MVKAAIALRQSMDIRCWPDMTSAGVSQHEGLLTVRHQDPLVLLVKEVYTSATAHLRADAAPPESHQQLLCLVRRLSSSRAVTQGEVGMWVSSMQGLHASKHHAVKQPQLART